MHPSSKDRQDHTVGAKSTKRRSLGTFSSNPPESSLEALWCSHGKLKRASVQVREGHRVSAPSLVMSLRARTKLRLISNCKKHLSWAQFERTTIQLSIQRKAQLQPNLFGNSETRSEDTFTPLLSVAWWVHGQLGGSSTISFHHPWFHQLFTSASLDVSSGFGCDDLELVSHPETVCFDVLSRT